MNIFTENLGVEICIYYRTLALEYGKIPKVFTLVKEDGHQFLFFVDDLQMEREEESDFLTFIIKEENAVCYARGGLFVQENEQQTIEVYISDRHDPQGIWCEAKLTRDRDGRPAALSDFHKQLGPREKILYSWLFNQSELSEERAIAYKTTWEAIKPRILNRQMQPQQ
jgi:hypothetical protein